MISHSERAVGSGVPVRLLGGALKNAVSRLEFYPVEEPVLAPEVSEVFVDEDVRPAEELSAVDLRMEMQAQVEGGRREARADARREWEEELERRIAEERAQVVRACEEFGQECVRYFAAIETEVVKLALAIAARVLHREVKMDPLLLAGVVRVALDKVTEDRAVVLRVPAGTVEMWRGALMERKVVDVELVGDERMERGECVLETSVGKVELGLSAQLEEIEKGFFDLLQQRPA